MLSKTACATLEKLNETLEVAYDLIDDDNMISTMEPQDNENCILNSYDWGSVKWRHMH